MLAEGLPESAPASFSARPSQQRMVARRSRLLTISPSYRSGSRPWISTRGNTLPSAVAARAWGSSSSSRRYSTSLPRPSTNTGSRRGLTNEQSSRASPSIPERGTEILCARRVASVVRRNRNQRPNDSKNGEASLDPRLFDNPAHPMRDEKTRSGGRESFRFRTVPETNPTPASCCETNPRGRVLDYETNPVLIWQASETNPTHPNRRSETNPTRGNRDSETNPA